MLSTNKKNKNANAKNKLLGSFIAHCAFVFFLIMGVSEAHSQTTFYSSLGEASTDATNNGWVAYLPLTDVYGRRLTHLSTIQVYCTQSYDGSASAGDGTNQWRIYPEDNYPSSSAQNPMYSQSNFVFPDNDGHIAAGSDTQSYTLGINTLEPNIDVSNYQAVSIYLPWACSADTFNLNTSSAGALLSGEYAYLTYINNSNFLRTEVSGTVEQAPYYVGSGPYGFSVQNFDQPLYIDFNQLGTWHSGSSSFAPGGVQITESPTNPTPFTFSVAARTITIPGFSLAEADTTRSYQFDWSYTNQDSLSTTETINFTVAAPPAPPPVTCPNTALNFGVISSGEGSYTGAGYYQLNTYVNLSPAVTGGATSQEFDDLVSAGFVAFSWTASDVSGPLTVENNDQRFARVLAPSEFREVRVTLTATYPSCPGLVSDPATRSIFSYDYPGAAVAVVDAGVDQSVNEGEVVTLSGSVDSVQSVQWTQVSGTSTVTLSNLDALGPTFTAPSIAAGQATEDYVFQLNSGSSYDYVTVTVAILNAAPSLDVALVDQTATEDVEFSYVVPADSFTDADGDTLTFTATIPDGVTWLNFDAATRTFSGTPSNAEVGTISVTVSASDGVASVSDTFDITVANVNDAPVVAVALVDQTATEDTAFSYLVPADSFTDADIGDTLTFTAEIPQAAWLSFNAATRVFSGTPSNDNVGTISVTVTASDGVASVSDAFDITVANVNDAPVVAVALVDQTATEDVAFSYLVPADSFTDADIGDTLTFTATIPDGVTWLNFDAATRTFSGTPLNDDGGTIAVTVTATDGVVAVSDAFDITVANVNDAPTLTKVTPSINTYQPGAFNIFVDGGLPVLLDMFQASDEEGDTLTYSWRQYDNDTIDYMLVSHPNYVSLTNADTLTPSFTYNLAPTDDDVTLTFNLQVSDGISSSWDSVNVYVFPPENVSPVVAVAIEDQSVTVQSQFSLTIPDGTFTDANASDTLSYAATIPAAQRSWLSFNPTTRTFSGTPPNANVGDVFDVTVTATDGSNASVSDTFVVTVLSPAVVACDVPANVGLVGTGAGCIGMLIVDLGMLQTATCIGSDCSIAHAGQDYTFGNSALNVYTGQVTDFTALFEDNGTFDADIEYWDVSSATAMASMFNNASSFNQDISGWDVSSVPMMARMFNGAASFNQDLSGWCVSAVPDVAGATMNFADGAGFAGQFAHYPQWGTCPPLSLNVVTQTLVVNASGVLSAAPRLRIQDAQGSVSRDDNWRRVQVSSTVGLEGADATAVDGVITFNALSLSTGTSLADDGNVYTLTFTDLDGALAAITATVQVDSARPTVGISAPVNGDPTASFTATFEFSESVVGFALDDIAVTNGAASSFSGSGATYTAQITPDGIGDVTIAVAANAATDAAGNGSQIAQPVIVDVTVPMVTLQQVPLSASFSFSITIEFSEAVIGFANGDISLVNATLTNLTGTGSSYQATFTPTGAGDIQISLAADVAADAAGNGNTASAVSTIAFVPMRVLQGNGAVVEAATYVMAP